MNKKFYRIYKIECDIDIETGEQLNDYLPIYIGSTSQTLGRRFSSHKHRSSKLYPYIQKYGKEHFRIKEITTIYSNKTDAVILEGEITLQYRKKYKLINKKYGNNPFYDNEEYNIQKKISINDKIFNSIKAAAKELNIPSYSLYNLLSGKLLESHSYKIDLIENDIYKIVKINKSTTAERIGEANTKKIKFHLIDEDKDFFSIREIANYLNISTSAIFRLIKYGLSKTIRNNKPYTCKDKQIINIIQHDDFEEYVLKTIQKEYIFNMNTKDVSTSSVEAVKLISSDLTPKHLHECCNNVHKSIKGHHFRYLTKAEIDLYKQNENNRFNFDCSSLYEYLQSKFVMNIDTMKIYESRKQALRDINYAEGDSSYITNCCKGNAKVAYGYHWRYLTIEEIKSIINKQIQK